jgi:PAS domain S-box-containing protein
MASRPGLDGCSEAFAAAVCAMSAPMLITDAGEPDHPIVFVNDAFCRMTGYARADIIGRNCRFLQGADKDPITVAAIRTAIALGRSVEADILNYRRNGEPFWNRLLILPVRDETG